MITNKEHSNLLKNYKTSLIINELYNKPKFIKVMFGNKVLEKFREVFQSASLPFPVSSSTIYETFYDLESKGYVISKWTGDEFLNKRSKKIYSITDEGIYYYKHHIADYIHNLEKTKNTLDLMINVLK